MSKPTPITIPPHLHVCHTCEEAWRDNNPKPTPCPDCEQPTPIGDITTLHRICSGRQP